MKPLFRKLLRSAARILAAVAAILFAAWFVFAQPSCRRHPPSPATADPARLRAHVEKLSQEFHPRNYLHPDNLARAADYIARHFEQAGATVEFQSFTVSGMPYRNVIGRFRAGPGPKLVVGAHYDACDELPGADDNASGVAALLELAALLGRSPPPGEVELVAYCLEEPPFFQTDHMGSVLHAQRLAAEKDRVRGVLVFEMVGYFDDTFGSQSYPLPLLHLLYPSRGNFIGVIGRWDQGPWVQAVKNAMKGRTPSPSIPSAPPASSPASTCPTTAAIGPTASPPS
jgi:Zn-dependent M28 family amino/carboxypeptidase